MELECHRIAGKILGNSENAAGLLNFVLYNELSEINKLCSAAGGEIKSRQIVALAIHDFAKRNPTIKLIGG